MATMTANAPAAAPPEGEEPKKGGKKKLVLILVVLLLAGGGAGYWFFLKPKGNGKPAPPTPGVVMPIDAIQINLADNHYLRIGLGLQTKSGAPQDLDGSHALDDTIELFSGQQMEKLSQKAFRDALKAKLAKQLDKDYDGDIYDVYFREFVMQ